MLILTARGLPTLRLKQAVAADCDDLRSWKNANRQHFFFKGEISPDMQADWFAKLQARHPHDVMLMVQEHDGATFINTGCMGYRLLEKEKVTDIYNILRGRRVAGSLHTMGEALNLMNTFLHTTKKLPVTCKVLAANPARQWYEAHGFENAGTGTEKGDDYIVYRLNPAKLDPVEVEVSGA